MQDSTMTLDKYDKLILDALQKDGRISNVQLAGLVSLSESACGASARWKSLA